VCWLCICAAVPKAAAQSNATLINANSFFKFDFAPISDNIQRFPLNQLLFNVPGAASISTNDGKLLYYSRRGFVFSNSNELLYQSIKDGTPFHGDLGLGEFFLSINENEHIHLLAKRNMERGFNNEAITRLSLKYNILNKTLNNGLGGVINKDSNIFHSRVIQSDIRTLSNNSFFSNPPVRLDSNIYLYFLGINNVLYASKIDNYSFKLIDSMNIPYNDFYPLSDSDIKSFSIGSHIVVNNEGTRILLSKHILGYLNNLGLPNSDLNTIRSHHLNIIEFDINNLRFNQERQVIILGPNQIGGENPKSINKLNLNFYSAVSDNDSFVYYMTQSEDWSATNLIRCPLYGDSFYFEKIHTFEERLTNSDGLREVPNGEIIIFKHHHLSPNDLVENIYVIRNPNKVEKPEIEKLNNYKKEITNYSAVIYQTSIKDHIRLRYKVDYDCGATVKFENFSNPYRKFDTFTWWITNQEGTIDTLVTHEPELRYTKNGSYFYKVYGRSNQGYGYGEMWYDSIKINIPAKPVADFSVKDTIVCAHSPAFFTPLCTTDTIHPTREEEWHWDFGDGSQSVIYRSNYSNQVRHTYTEPGTYTVTLRYYNGFCDSVLTQENIIQIVEAPKPGFEVSAVQGCAPLSVEFIDTVTLYVQRKEYYFQDIDSWREIHLSQTTFNYTFDNSGWHWVVQQLVGYTGCVTRTDSVQIMVSKGFTASDTSHIFVATWQDVLPKEENWVSVQWDCMDETAHSYELKRNNQTMATFTDCNGIGSFEDKEANAHPNLRYRIVAADSCGTATQIGRIGQPIYLQGAIKGQNEWAVIEFSPYADIQHQSGEFSYDIQTFGEGIWKSLTQQNSAGLFEDKPLISNDVNALEKCYRIVGQNQAQTSISNVLCLPYLPSVILPSAFSPNGDALNEIYRPLTLGIVSYQMEIYNRWGQLIYSGDESQIGWDGKGAPQGVYVVKIQGIDNQNFFHIYVGNVTLVR
jgi:gliding motility-associated-like protein